MALAVAGCAGSSGSVASNTTVGEYNSSGGYGNSSGGTTASGAFAPTNPSVSPARASAAEAAAAKLTSGATVGSSAYMIGPLDVIDVSVFKVPDLTKTVQVADDGTVNLPLVGDVPAAGKTAHEMERELQQKLGAKYIRNPQVTVFVKESNANRVTVEGAVKNSGVFPIKGRTTLMQVMAMAGGVNMDVYSGDVVIFRTINGTALGRPGRYRRHQVG